MPPRTFLLSPARSDGKRAAMLLREEAAFDLALRLRSEEGAPIGEVYAFLSGLYFRGKLAYARAVAARVGGGCETWVIVPGRGLLRPDERVRRDDLLACARVPVDAEEPRYRGPLEEAVRARCGGRRARGEVVLLGSVASAKYVDVLLPLLGARLRFPAEFVGRGDMSRGGLMLRCAREGRELATVPVEGSVRTGARPPRLAPLPRSTRHGSRSKVRTSPRTPTSSASALPTKSVHGGAP